MYCTPLDLDKALQSVLLWELCGSVATTPTMITSDGHGSANPPWVVGVGEGCHLQTHRPSAATLTYPSCGCEESAFRDPTCANRAH